MLVSSRFTAKVARRISSSAQSSMISNRACANGGKVPGAQPSMRYSGQQRDCSSLRALSSLISHRMSAARYCYEPLEDLRLMRCDMAEFALFMSNLLFPMGVYKSAGS